jgi:ferredoxin
MEDPECVRCSACVQGCPTGVLTFGQVDRTSGEVVRTDPPWLAASSVQRIELKVREVAEGSTHHRPPDEPGAVGADEPST